MENCLSPYCRLCSATHYEQRKNSYGIINYVREGFIQDSEKALKEKGFELSSSEFSAIQKLISLRFDEVISKSEQQGESFTK
ncbi:MAG: hypothetical protein PHP67_09020 [Sphaerochaeta sp.]|uniref:hypothetical protein n=1 Tax=Sphaerochaeta sp. S2 TaxID=2798868 RepID=UPI0018E99875|nr:hypothetical protein [Sphaerochaeta sp. S2]MCK9348806.1 hypothetical protein [Sphaerochaeta sp.]MBJ2357369.1 hypothetical protein [Sphaerochaeta sp. S2]MDD4301842.1 hypothetical protein [Sphaerochaeta sp.]MDD4648350.1 hypothetical protein [Sphaerochaeta sp.]MDY0243728.1 hypothetical protein [Sphaerochaeta sp.]